MISGGTIGERLDRLPTAKFHYRILWLIGLGMFFDGFDVYLAGGVLGALVKTGWSNIHLNATFISATFLGLFIGAVAAGFVGDHFGRKFSYQLNLLIFGLASIAAALSPNMTWLITFRLIMGIGLGAELVIGYGTFSEFVPARTRGQWLSILALITNTSLPLSALLGFLVIPSLGWRWMFVIVGLGSLIVWYLRKALPESPRWYESRGLAKKADELVSSIEKEIEIEKGIALPPVKEKDSETTLQPQKQGSYLDLFRGSLIRRTIVACVMLIGLTSALYAFVSWLPTIFVKEGINISTSLGYTAIMMIGGPIGAFVGALILDRLGRKWTTAIFFLVASFLGYAYALQRTPLLIIVCGFCLITIIYMLVAVGFGVYTPELFPTEVRLRGAGTAQALGRLATIFSPYGVAWLLVNLGPKPVFLSISGVFIIVALVVATLGIETKKRSLEEISQSIDATVVS